jgi:hypothetical protein
MMITGDTSMQKTVWSNNSETALAFFQDANVIFDNPPVSTYDGVYLDMLLQQAKRIEVTQFLTVFFKGMTPGAKIVVTVPSLEWACKKVGGMDNPPATAYIALYGTDEQPHMCGLTIHWLRLVCEQVGFKTYAAYSAKAEVVMGDHREDILQNIYIGEKPMPNPEDALDVG